MKNRVVLLLALVAVGCKPPAVHPVTPAASHRMAALGGTTNASAVNFDPQQTAITATPGALAVQNILGTLKQVNDQGVVTTIGGGGSGTVNVSTGLSGDGSIGTPLVNTAPFGPDTTILLPNSTPTSGAAWRGVSTLTTLTPGAEVGQYVISLPDGASAFHLVPAMTIGPKRTLFPINTDQRTASVAFPGHESTGLTWLASGSIGVEVLGIAVGNTTSGLPNFQFDSSGTLTLSGGSGGARVYFGSALDMVIGKFGSATTLTINNSNAAGTIVNQIGGVTALGIDHSLNVSLGKTNPGATATAGFPCIPASSGPPTGAFTPPTGFAGLYMDSTAHKVYANDGSGWVALN